MGKNCSKPSKGHNDGQSLPSVLKKMSLKLCLFRLTKKAKGDLIFVSHCLVGHYRDSGFRLITGQNERTEGHSASLKKRK